MRHSWLLFYAIANYNFCIFCDNCMHNNYEDIKQNYIARKSPCHLYNFERYYRIQIFAIVATG